MRSPLSLRWVAITVFVFSSVLNYLDRQVLATMVTIKGFPFSASSDYGMSLSAFSLAYALSALFIGWFVDRVGLNRGISISVALWAIASFGTGMSHNISEFLLWRALLGVAEASGVSAVGKAVGMYLPPKERATGTALSQLGLSLGGGLAPRFAVIFADKFGWSWAFYGAGVVSLIWIPVWLLTARAIPPTVELAPPGGKHSFGLLADPKLWALIGANFLSMTIYSLWTNWPPIYLVQVHHLSGQQASHYTPVVPICGYFGALAGGSLSWRLINKGMSPIAARKRACLIAAVLLLGTMTIPFLPTPALATAGMSLSFFLICAWSTNHYTLPIDIYGAGRAAFAIGGLIFAYGAMQAVVSRPVGIIIERYGFQPVCFTFALLPLLSYLLVHFVVREDAVGLVKPA
jgi:ACS family hexuronate transporter-like MFS transporter